MSFNPDRIVMDANILCAIINDLNNSPELQQMFGVPVAAYLVVVSDMNDLRIEEAGKIPLTQQQQQRFVQILDQAIQRQAQGGGGAPVYQESYQPVQQPPPSSPGSYGTSSQWQVGDRAVGKWSGDNFWYPCTVGQVHESQVYVRFDDGDEQWTTMDCISRLDLAIGDRIQCRWKGERLYYPGRVMQIHGEQIYVVYETGPRKWSTFSFMRMTL